MLDGAGVDYRVRNAPKGDFFGFRIPRDACLSIATASACVEKLLDAPVVYHSVELLAADAEQLSACGSGHASLRRGFILQSFYV